MRALIAAIGFLVVGCYGSTRGVVELDAASFHALITSEDRDLVFFFFDSVKCKETISRSNQCTATLELADALVLRVGSSIGVAIMDTGLHGFPAGLHVHSSPAVVLVAAGDRGSFEFAADASTHHAFDSETSDWHHTGSCSGRHSTDELAIHANDDHSAAFSTCLAHGGHYHGCTDATGHRAAADDSDGDHVHHQHVDEEIHVEASQLRIAPLLSWLRERTTYPSDVPLPTLGDVWRGRQAGLMRAVVEGIEALRQLEVERAAEVTYLRQRVQKLEAALATHVRR